MGKNQGSSGKKVSDLKHVSKLLWRTADKFATGSKFINECVEELSLKSEENNYNPPDTGDSRYILLVLSVELYLKFLYLNEREEFFIGHGQGSIFNELKKDTQDQILKEINAHSPFCEEKKNALNKDTLSQALTRAGRNFTEVRYLFDDSKKSPEEIEQRNKCFREEEYHGDNDVGVKKELHIMLAVLEAVEKIALDRFFPIQSQEL